MADSDDDFSTHAVLTGAMGLIALAAAWLFAVSGRPRWTIAVSATIATVGVVSAAVMARRRNTRQLSHRAFHDDLTGLANRARFLDRLDRALGSDGVPALAVLFVDLDDFKRVNDTFGHAAGDVVLSTVGERLLAWVRPTDTVARFGGDEFAVLLTEVDEISARHVAEQLRATLDAPIDVDELELRIGTSIGVAVAAPGVATVDLLRHADTAMYRAKRAGKRRVHLFDGTAGPTSSSEIQSAAERDELRLVYLPEVDLRSGLVIGVEALVRWEHPELGLLAASSFLEEAERSGDLDAVGRWAIERAVADAARWRPRTRVSINVAAVQLDALDLVSFLGDALERHAVDPSDIRIEVPERALAGSAVRTRALDGLRRLGCGLAVEGFTAGACPLQRVGDRDIETIKIDAALSASIDSDERNRALVGSIVAWSRAAGISTVAPVIERASQLDAFCRLGCDAGQGRLLAPALDAAEVPARLSW